MWVIVPASVLETWPTLSTNPVRRGPELWITTGIFLTLAIASVILRLHHRLFVRRFFGIDDVLIILALIFTLGVSVSVSIGNIKLGWDIHVYDLPFALFHDSLLNLYFSRICWSIASSLVRLSVLCLYYRLLNECNGQRYRWVLHLVTGYTIALMLMYVFASIFICWPIYAFWTWSEPMSKCGNDRLVMFITAILNTSSEFLVAILPLFGIFYLGVTPKQRWSVISLLCLGFLVTIAGCFRIYYVHKIMTTWDVTWWSMPQWICSEVEIDVALICACAAPLRPMLGRLYYRLLGIKVTGTTSSSSSSSRMQIPLAHQPARLGTDQEAIHYWESSLMRAIDLEGISDDGLGYTVEIAGPRGRRDDELETGEITEHHREKNVFARLLRRARKPKPTTTKHPYPLSTTRSATSQISQTSLSLEKKTSKQPERHCRSYSSASTTDASRPYSPSLTIEALPQRPSGDLRGITARTSVQVSEEYRELGTEINPKLLKTGWNRNGKRSGGGRPSAEKRREGWRESIEELTMDMSILGEKNEEGNTGNSPEKRGSGDG